MPVLQDGTIVDEQGKPTGQKVNLATGTVNPALGTADRTNQLLGIASQKTGLPAPTFTNQPNQTLPVAPTAQNLPPTPTNQPKTITIPTPVVTSPETPKIEPAPQLPEKSLHDEIMGIFSELGIQPPSPNQSPISSAADIYKQFAYQSNLFGTKKDIEDLIKKKTDEIANVNEDPFISEGVRQKKIANIENKYETRLSMLQSTFTRADEDARFLTGKYLEQVHQTQQNTQDYLFKAIDLAEKDITARRAERKESERIREFETRQLQQERQFEIRERQQEQQFEIRERESERREREREREFNIREKRLTGDRATQSISDWADQIESGKVKLVSVPKELKSLVISELNKRTKSKPTDGGSVWGHIKGFFGGLSF